MSRRHKSSDTTPFDTLRFEGSLVAPDLLERTSSAKAAFQREADYAIHKILNLHIEYGRANPQWLTDADLTPFLAAEPAANLTESAATDHIQTTLDFLQSQTPYLGNLATERANALLADHRRVREAARDIRSYEVTPCLPVDVLGVYVLLPASL